MPGCGMLWENHHASSNSIQFPSISQQIHPPVLCQSVELARPCAQVHAQSGAQGDGASGSVGTSGTSGTGIGREATTSHDSAVFHTVLTATVDYCRL